MTTVLEKQIVFRAKRLIRVRKFKCLFFIFISILFANFMQVLL